MQKEMYGIVTRGDGRGRAIGFPTANLLLTPPPDLSFGIYAAQASLGQTKKALPAVVHFGPRPTFSGTAATFEVHLIHFPDRDLYDEKLTVLLKQKIRDIESFNSIVSLTEAIARDIEKALEILNC